MGKAPDFSSSHNSRGKQTYKPYGHDILISAMVTAWVSLNVFKQKNMHANKIQTDMI